MFVELLIQHHRWGRVQIGAAEAEDALASTCGLAGECQDQQVKFGVSAGCHDRCEEAVQLPVQECAVWGASPAGALQPGSRVVAKVA